MRSLMPVFAAAMVPLAVIILAIVGNSVGLIQWRPPQIWAVDFGTPHSDNGVIAISSDASGLYATGYLGDTGFFPHVTPSELYVTRSNFNGQRVWTQTFGSPDLSQTSALSLGQDAVYVAGTLNGTSFVKKYDLNGSEVWTRSFGSGASGALAISVATSGVYVGYYQGSRLFLRDYDFSGNLSWIDPLGNYTGGLSLYASAEQLYVLHAETNTLVQRYDSNGLLVWTQTCSCAAQIANGISGDSAGIYVMGLVQNLADANAKIAKYDLNGNLIWTAQIGAPDNTSVGRFQISADPSGAYLTLSTGGARSFLMKYDPSGNKIWSIEIQALESRLSVGIAVSVSRNSVFVGGSVEKSFDTLDARLAEFGQSSSLIFFGLNPPSSFATVGILATAAATSVFVFMRLRRKRSRPPRDGPIPHTIPAAD